MTKWCGEKQIDWFRSMNIWNVVQTHWREWSSLEIGCFVSVLVIFFVGVGVMLRQRKIAISQAAACFVFLIIYALILGTTVFTRTVSVNFRYELMPLWSWWKAFAERDLSIQTEIFLNIMMFVPIGLLLPWILHRGVKANESFLWGIGLSAVIEICQLVFKLGLFEWDDMIHNGLGCMAGSVLMTTVLRKGKK